MKSNTPDRLAHVFKHYGIEQEDTPERVDMLERVVEDAPGCRVRKGGYIYFIRHGESNSVKVGLARDPNIRLCTLQIGNPVELSIMRADEVDDMETEENRFHSLLAHDRARGEWFSLDDTQIGLIASTSTIIELFLVLSVHNASVHTRVMS